MGLEDADSFRFDMVPFLGTRSISDISARSETTWVAPAEARLESDKASGQRKVHSNTGWLIWTNLYDLYLVGAQPPPFAHLLVT